MVGEYSNGSIHNYFQVGGSSGETRNILKTRETKVRQLHLPFIVTDLKQNLSHFLPQKLQSAAHI